MGAGITGLSVALHLVEGGESSVVLYERASVGAGASGIQPGGVRLQWGTEVNCRMALESLDFYRELDDRLQPLRDPGFRPCGYLFVAHSTRALERLAANVELQRSLGVPSRIVGPEVVEELVPDIDSSSIAGASFCPADGYFDRPQAVVEAFAEAAQRGGMRIEHEDVSSVEPDGAGWSLVLQSGGRVHADRVLVAAGTDSTDLLRRVGVELPIVPERRYIGYSDPIGEQLLEPLVVSAELRFAAKQLGDGRVLASDLGARADRGTAEPEWHENVRAGIRKLLPRLEYVAFPLVVEGVYDVTPDRQAVLGAIPGCDGLFVAAGFSGHGFMMAPAVGRIVGAAMAGDEEDGALRTLGVDRFARGELVPEPAVV